MFRTKGFISGRAKASALPGTPSGPGAVIFLPILFIAKDSSTSVTGGTGGPEWFLVR